MDHFGLQFNDVNEVALWSFRVLSPSLCPQPLGTTFKGARVSSELLNLTIHVFFEHRLCTLQEESCTIKLLHTE